MEMGIPPSNFRRCASSAYFAIAGRSSHRWRWSTSESIVGPGEIGLGEQAFRRLGMDEGSEVWIEQARPPASLEFVRRKIDGEVLSASEVSAVIQDITLHLYSPMEIGAFLVACAGFMSTQETLSLTEAMVNVGNSLHWDSPLVVDKHCIGGIPGNRTSMIVVPIVAAHGLLCPKTSSRAITSPSGTADTMEVLANVDLSENRLVEIVRQEKGVLAWGGRVNLSPADDILITVERPLRLDRYEQMVASILSKKVSAGSTHLVIDIPVGPTAKVRTPRRCSAAPQDVRICRAAYGHRHRHRDHGRLAAGRPRHRARARSARRDGRVAQRRRCAGRPARSRRPAGRARARVRSGDRGRPGLCPRARTAGVRRGARGHGTADRGPGAQHQAALPSAPITSR